MSLPGVGEWSFILQNYMKKDNNLLGKQGKIHELKEKEN